MKPVLNPLQYLRVTLKDSKDFRVRLLEHSDGFGETFRPVCKTSAMVWSAKEYYPTSAVEDFLKMSFRSLLCC